MRSQQQLISGPVEGYKIVNEDMTCRGFKFETGKRIKLQNTDALVLCQNGFHFCKYPSGPWSYYSSGRVFKVRAYGVLDTPLEPGAEYKMVCEEIELYEEVLIGGDSNTGNRNTGNSNTGNWNTGDWNCGDFHTGALNHVEAPVYLFNEQAKVKRADIPWHLVNQLGALLERDETIDPAPFLDIPNATPSRIKALHRAFIEARAKL